MEEFPLSVAFVTFNSRDHLEVAIDSVRRHIGAAEVVVVDNGSSDDTVDVAARLNVAACLEGHGNLGFGAGMNLAVNTASHEHVLLLNPDARVTSFDPLEYQTVIDRSEMGLVGCSLQEGRKNRPNLASSWSWRLELAWTMYRAFLQPGWLNTPRPELSKKRPWCSGFALLVRKREFEAIGGFSPRFFMYWEDRELSHRYSAGQLPVTSTSSVAVEHDWHGSATGAASTLTLSALGFLEWVDCIWGEATSETAAFAYARSLASLHRLAMLTATRGRCKRAARKAELASVVARQLRDPSWLQAAEGSYPGARAALARALASSSATATWWTAQTRG